MKTKIQKLYILSLLGLFVNCSAEFRLDQHHYLKSDQHFSSQFKSSNQYTIDNLRFDTIYFARLVKAVYRDRFYKGSSKGAAGYWEFERAYFAFRQDTGSVLKSLKYLPGEFDNGSYGVTIPNPDRCIQFAYGYPKSNSKISNSPVMIVGDSIYYCINKIDTLSIGTIKYTSVFRYLLNSPINKEHGNISEILFSNTEGIIRYRIENNEEWNKMNASP
jgi:hypothetical protein